MSLAIPQATDLYAVALHSMTEPDGHRHWYARYEDGPRRSLAEALRRWCGTADATDQDLLERAPGAVLDLGCGPGRLVIELARQGRQAAGVDTSRVAVRLARKAGATAVCRSIFDPVPGEGGWDSVLLADGNIGIGGDPVSLLARCRDLITTSGRVLLELDPPGTGMRSDRVRLERGSQRGCGSTGRTSASMPSTARLPRPACASWRPGSGPAGRSPPSSRTPPSARRSAWRSDRAHPHHRRRRVHRVARGAGARDAGHEVRVLDALLPAVHPAGVEPRLPDGVELVHRRRPRRAIVDRALRGVDAVCHQAAMVGLGVDVQDMPDYAGINELGTAVLLAAWPGRRRPAGAGQLDGRLRRGPLRVRRRTASSRPRPGAAADLAAGRFEPPCPVCGRPLARAR